jgi:predicted dehydrogenase
MQRVPYPWRASSWPPRTTHDHPFINRPDIEAVILATLTTLHTEVALAAIAARPHGACQTPLAASLDDAHQMIAATERQGVVSMRDERRATRWNVGKTGPGL